MFLERKKIDSSLKRHVKSSQRPIISLVAPVGEFYELIKFIVFYHKKRKSEKQRQESSKNGFYYHWQSKRHSLSHSRNHETYSRNLCSKLLLIRYCSKSMFFFQQNLNLKLLVLYSNNQNMPVFESNIMPLFCF